MFFVVFCSSLSIVPFYSVLPFCTVFKCQMPMSTVLYCFYRLLVFLLVRIVL